MASEYIKYFIKFIIEGLQELIDARQSVEELNETSKLPFGAPIAADVKSSMAVDAGAAAAATSAAGMAAVAAAGVGAALLAVDIAVEQLQDSLKQGSALLLLHDQLSSVSDVTGITASEIEGRLIPVLQGVVTDAEMVALALEAIEEGATSLEDIEEYAVEAVEAMGLLEDGVRTTSGELVYMKNALDDLKANTGAAALKAVLPIIEELNESLTERGQYIAIERELKNLGYSFWDIEEAMREYGITAWRSSEGLARYRQVLYDARIAAANSSPELRQWAEWARRTGEEADWAVSGVMHLSDALRGLYVASYGADRKAYFGDLEENPNFDPEQAARDEAVRRSQAKHEDLNLMYDDQSDYYNELDEIPMHLRNAEDAMYGYAGSIHDADAAMDALRASTGSLFDETRRGFEDDFNAAEYFYEQMLASGASAKQAMDFLILSELESPEKALEMYEQTVEKAALKRSASWAVEGDDVEGFWNLGQQALDNPELANQLGGGTIINEQGTVIQITFSGGVMDPEMVSELVGEILVEQLQGLGVLP